MKKSLFLLVILILSLSTFAYAQINDVLVDQGDYKHDRFVPRQYHPDNNTVALYHLNEGRGNTTEDATKNNNHGTLQKGASFIKQMPLLRRNRYSISLDGVDDSVFVPDSNSLDITNEITLEAWVYVTDDCPNSVCTQRIISKWQTDNWWSGRSYLLALGNGFDPSMKMQPGCHLRDANPSAPFPQQWSAEAQEKIQLNTWTHLACVYNGTNIMIYIDGKLKADSTQFPHNFKIANSITNLGIGADVDDPNQYNFAGSIDEVRISDKARKPEEFNVPR